MEEFFQPAPIYGESLGKDLRMVTNFLRLEDLVPQRWQLNNLYLFLLLLHAKGGSPHLISSTPFLPSTEKNTFKIHFLPFFSLCCDVSLSLIGPRVSGVKPGH